MTLTFIMSNVITLYHFMSSPVLCPEDEVNSAARNTTRYSDGAQLIYNKVWGLTTTVPIFITVIIGPLINFRSVTFFTKFNSLGKSMDGLTKHMTMHETDKFCITLRAGDADLRFYITTVQDG
jgi:hypothetical protein